MSGNGNGNGTGIASGHGAFLSRVEFDAQRLTVRPNPMSSACPLRSVDPTPATVPPGRILSPAA